MTEETPSMPRPVRRTAAAAALALALGAGAGACRSGDEAEPAADPTPTQEASAPAERTVATRVSVGQVSGRMTKQVRQRLERQVGAVVDGWTEAAYLGGDYPRRGFADSWPGFTRGAQDRARRDRALMSNQDIGDRIDGVRPRRSVVVADVLAPGGRPAAVTARVSLRFTTTGDLERTVRVQGRLFLTRVEGRWKVFGYDVTKGAV